MGIRARIKDAVNYGLSPMRLELRRVVDDRPSHRFTPAEPDKFNWLREAGIRTVIDVGANTGEFACNILDIMPSVSIYSFEPLAKCHEALERRMKGISTFRAFKFGLGDRDEIVVIYHNEFSPSSSILPMSDLHRASFPFTTKSEKEVVSIRPLDSVAAELDLRHNLLVKIDVQGFEGRVIAGGMETIKMATHVIVETSFAELYQGQPLFDHVYQQLKELGFCYSGALDQLLSPVDGRILQADALFIRSSTP